MLIFTSINDTIHIVRIQRRIVYIFHIFIDLVASSSSGVGYGSTRDGSIDSSNAHDPAD